MKKILLLLMFITSMLFPQLKEMEVKPTTQKGGIPVNRDNPEKAAIFFYTQFDDLSFWSNYGIVDIKGDSAGGKYIVIVEPVRQTIEVRRKGFKTEMIKLESLQPRDVLYYEVLPKKEEGISGVTEIGITVQATPSDATILLDDKPFPNNVTTKVFLGSHNLRVEKAGYGSTVQEIVVTPEKTLFKIDLEKVSLSPITIKSNPSNGKVYINNELKGTTEVGIFLYSGSYELRVELPDYLPIIETIQVSPTTDKTKNVFSYNLVRNKGILELSVTPSNAIVSLNSEQSNISGSVELNPGIYDLEVKASQYDTYKEKIEIKRGETLKKSVNLTKNTGVLALNVQPSIAVVNINKEKKSGNRFELIPGVYEIEIASETFYSEIFTVTIEKGKTIERTVTLKQKTGVLQFTIKPLEAKVILKQNGVEKYSWEGINIIENIPEGVYDLTAKASGYKIFTDKITIKENQSTIEDIQMVMGSDTPEGMVLVEGGTFTMGSNNGSDEDPPHKVTVGSYYIGKTELTLGLFEKFIKSTNYQTDADKDGWSYIWTGSVSQKKSGVNWRCDTKGDLRNNSERNHPVIHVSWYDAVSYCNWLSEKEGLQKAYIGTGNNIKCDFNSNGYRLPTEAEWEFAAIGGNQSEGYKYSGSSDIDVVAWYRSNSGSKTHAVGTKQPNELGIYDMSGNVWEWCWDWYGDYGSGNQNDPKGANSGSVRVVRGGAYLGFPGICRVTCRIDFRGSPDNSASTEGFRLVRTK